MRALSAILTLVAVILPARLSAQADLVRTPTHSGEWVGDHVEWRSEYFAGRHADWQLNFAIPLPAAADVQIAPEADWDGAASLEIQRSGSGKIIAVQHRGTPTRGAILTKLPAGSVEPPLTPGAVHRLFLQGARVARPVAPLQAHLGSVRHVAVTDRDIERFDPVSGHPVFVLADAPYVRAGGLGPSIAADDEMRAEVLSILGVGLTAFVMVMLVVGTRVSARSRREVVGAA